VKRAKLLRAAVRTSHVSRIRSEMRQTERERERERDIEAPFQVLHGECELRRSGGCCHAVIKDDGKHTTGA